MTHVLWDWNGTLLDDTQAALDTLNSMLARRGGRPITMEFYRDHFAFPVKPFYKSIGVCLENEDWDALAREYHDVYAGRPKRLNPETPAALERVKASGARQSIISALRQDLLEEITDRLGVAKYMDRICGVDNLDGFGKIDRAREMLSSLRDSSGRDSSFVLIGDSLHDKEVADALGVACVLCGQGSHASWRLRAVAPTGDTLLDALELALGGRGR
ncbi:MAG: HAD family hydrolase [Kiritimatiellae bacterium]|nr:HAD family hydrolase [Kiritimatiellia bacterium]